MRAPPRAAGRFGRRRVAVLTRGLPRPQHPQQVLAVLATLALAHPAELADSPRVAPREPGIDVWVAGREERMLDLEACVETPNDWRLANPEVELELRRDAAALDGRNVVRDVAVTPALAITRYGCTTCHAISANSSTMVGPSLFARLGGVNDTTLGKRTINKAYLREAILPPEKSIVTGFAAAMPPYRNIIAATDPDELDVVLTELGR